MHPYISVSGNSALKRDRTCLHGGISLAEKLSLWSMTMCIEGQQVRHKQAWPVRNIENRQPMGLQHSRVLVLTAMSVPFAPKAMPLAAHSTVGTHI